MTDTPQPPTEAFKGFNPDLTCQGFQYEIGKSYELAEPPIYCMRGFHACLLPLDCWSYYNPVTSRYARVTLTGVLPVQVGESNSKIVGNAISTGEELTVEKIISLTREAILRKIGNDIKTQYGEHAFSVTARKPAVTSASGNAHALTAGVCTPALTLTYCSHALTADNSSHALTEATSSHALTAGCQSHACTTGYDSSAASTGTNSHTHTEGTYSPALAAGQYSCAITKGEASHAITAGNAGHARTANSRSHALTAGIRGSASTLGARSHAIATGIRGRAEAAGEESVAVSLGRHGVARAAAGGWIVLALWDNYCLLQIRAAKVGGPEGVKAGRLYRLDDRGEFEEVEKEV